MDTKILLNGVLCQTGTSLGICCLIIPTLILPTIAKCDIHFSCPTVWNIYPQVTRNREHTNVMFLLVNCNDNITLRERCSVFTVSIAAEQQDVDPVLAAESAISYLHRRCLVCTCTATKTMYCS